MPRPIVVIGANTCAFSLIFTASTFPSAHEHSVSGT
jgi:hypothetical protein